MKNALFITLTLLGLFLIYKLREPALAEHNKYNCAVLGYYEDCKTPLREEDKLK